MKRFLRCFVIIFSFVFAESSFAAPSSAETISWLQQKLTGLTATHKHSFSCPIKRTSYYSDRRTIEFFQIVNDTVNMRVRSVDNSGGERFVNTDVDLCDCVTYMRPRISKGWSEKVQGFVSLAFAHVAKSKIRLNWNSDVKAMGLSNFGCLITERRTGAAGGQSSRTFDQNVWVQRRALLEGASRQSRLRSNEPKFFDILHTSTECDVKP